MADLGEHRAGQPLVRPHVERGHLQWRQFGGNASKRIGREGQAGVGSAHQTHALLDRADARMMGVLGRPDGAVEPGVIGDVEQELRARCIAKVAGEQDFVADDRKEGRRAGQAQGGGVHRHAPSLPRRAQTA